MELKQWDKIFERNVENCRFSRKLKSFENLIIWAKTWVGKEDQQINNYIRQMY